MDLKREIEARPPGSEAERRAALEVAAALRALGRPVEVEAVSCWPRADLTYALHAAVAVAGSVLAIDSPTAGTAVVLAALAATFLDSTGTLLTTRRLLGRRATQNVVAPGGPVVLVTHLDTPRGGFAFGRRLRLPILQTAMAAVFACCLARVATDVDSTAFTAVQFALTLLVIGAGALHLDAAIAPARRQDLADPERAIDLARERPDLTVVVAGAHTCGAHGLRAYRRRHRKELRDARFVDLDDEAELSEPPA